MILSYMMKLKTENTDTKITNNYEILKINIEDTYRNLEKNFKNSHRKLRKISQNAKILEEDINTLITTYEEHQEKSDKVKSKESRKVFNVIEPIIILSTNSKELLSTCETHRQTTRMKKSERKISEKNFFLHLSENIHKYTQMYKLIFSKKLQLIELNKAVNDYYDSEIKILIKNKKAFKLDIITTTQPSNPITPPIRRQEENGDNDGIMSVLSCSSSRKNEQQSSNSNNNDKETCLIF